MAIDYVYTLLSSPIPRAAAVYRSGSEKQNSRGNTLFWEQRKVKDIADNTYGGGTPQTSIDSYWNGEIPWIQSQDIIENQLFNVEPRKHISEEAISKSATKLVPKNSIAIVTRVGVGKLAFMPFSYCTSQDFLSLSGIQIDEKYATYSIYQMLQKEKQNVQGTSINGITIEEMLSKKIPVPCNSDEQGENFLTDLMEMLFNGLAAIEGANSGEAAAGVTAEAAAVEGGN